MCINLHVNCLLLCQTLTKTEGCPQILVKTSNIKFHENLSGWTDVTNLLSAISFVKAPSKIGLEVSQGPVYWIVLFMSSDQ